VRRSEDDHEQRDTERTADLARRLVDGATDREAVLMQARDGLRTDFERRVEAIYLVIGLRNAGSGIAVLHGWYFYAERLAGRDHAKTDDFRRLTRDIYVPAGDIGFWQGAFRDPNEPLFAAARDAATSARPVTIDLLYGDHEGGQRMISRFALSASPKGSWLAVVGRHWNLDRPNPR